MVGPRRERSSHLVPAQGWSRAADFKSDEVRALIATESGSLHVRHEVADILIYALLMAVACGIDPAAAVREKLARNAGKYPISESKGRSTKYNELPTAGQQ